MQVLVRSLGLTTRLHALSTIRDSTLGRGVQYAYDATSEYLEAVTNSNGLQTQYSYNLAIGERSAEGIKIGIGSALYLQKKLSMEVRGRDMVSGLPRTITVGSDDVTEALQAELEGIISAVKSSAAKHAPRAFC